MQERTLRILQVVSSSATSGAENHTVVLAQALQQRGHHVEVVCPPIPWMLEAFERQNTPCHPLPLKEKAGFPALAYVLRLVKENKFDVIHTHLSRAAYVGYIAGSLRGVPVVSTVHVETKEPLYKFIPRKNNRLVAPSNFIRGVLRGRGVRDESIDVVYNGTDFTVPETASPFEVYDEFQIPHDRKIIGLVARVTEGKGQGIAVEALPKVLEHDPQAHLMFVGRTEGEYVNHLKSRISNQGLGDRITFTGNRMDVPRLIDAMEFSILPSVMESFGLAVIESMARSKPVVVSRVGALSELVAHEITGLVVDKNADAFSQAMAYLLAHPELCREMGLAGRQSILERFTVAQMTERMEAVYHKAVGISTH